MPAAAGAKPLLEEIDTVVTSVLLGVAAVERTPRSSRVVLIGQESASTGENGLPPDTWSGSAWLDD